MGPILVSTSTSPGLDLLLKAKHFHFNKNQLSDTIQLHPITNNRKVRCQGNSAGGAVYEKTIRERICIHKKPVIETDLMSIKRERYKIFMS
ncbi:leucine-rich repeat receptor protein kinase HPCA1-like [Gastrolobium bilobum]|uniref:leucine-rich repeat receptor protein kinase HPCA1-like n=1 Tax=Gastrolobium bilobum TaxID=150636 RepID=UPI002AAF9CB1|nr:leucine-rich repeat receptor protein kinase HPCA1-like [Gastrolobium bilobum]